MPLFASLATPLYMYQKSRNYVVLAPFDISSSCVLSMKTSLISSLMPLNLRSFLLLIKN